MKKGLQIRRNVLATIAAITLSIIGIQAQNRQEVLSDNVLKSTETAIFTKDSTLTYKYNMTSLKYEALWKKNYLYDENHLLQSIEYSIYDAGSKKYIAKWKEQYSYNELDKLTECLFSEISSGNWVNSQLFTYQYNGTKLLSCLIEKWNTTTKKWDNWRLDTYQFDINNRQKEYQTEYWDASSNNWIKSVKTTPAYNGLGLIQEALVESWSNGQWQNLNFENYNFNTQNLKTIKLIKSWNGSEWIDNDRFTFAYNSSNVVSSATKYVYNKDAAKWSYEKNTLYDYDSDLNLKQEVRKDFNNQTQTWNISTKEVSYWKKMAISTEINSSNDNTLTLSPNPAKDIINLKGINSDTPIEIYDMAGKLVKTINNYVVGKSINVSLLQRGIYVLKANNKVVQFIKQ
ncbi:MAG: T9SS type A sorting domain-containing protein [Marinilabiliaceae bacterium]|nr:T9SS type A sorting domain-containing protein [Marinilabiliaceae bacterium]